MNEEAKAVQEVAKATARAIDAARDAGTFIARFVEGPLEEGVGIYRDHLKYLRWERQVRLMQRAEHFLKQAGLTTPTRAVSLRIAVPLLQAAIIEEDDLLQDRWARLLVNAANADSGLEIHRSYVSILEQLSSLDAQILDAIYSLPFDIARSSGISTDELPSSAKALGKDENPKSEPSQEISVALGNLVRLGCVKVPTTWDGGEIFSAIYPTVLGAAFVSACRIPKI